MKKIDYKFIISVVAVILAVVAFVLAILGLVLKSAVVCSYGKAGFLIAIGLSYLITNWNKYKSQPKMKALILALFLSLVVLSVGIVVNAMPGTAEIRYFSLILSAIGCICVFFIVIAEILKK